MFLASGYPIRSRPSRAEDMMDLHRNHEGGVGRRPSALIRTVRHRAAADSVHLAGRYRPARWPGGGGRASRRPSRGGVVRIAQAAPSSAPWRREERCKALPTGNTPRRTASAAGAALAILLSGCTVTVTTTGPVAPIDLVGYTLVFTHGRQEGVLLAHSENFHFKSAGSAFDANLNEAWSWTYSRKSRDSGTVSVIFRAGSAASRVTCALTFDNRRGGTHECVHVHSATFAFITLTSEGSSSGTFVLRPI